MSVLSAYFDKSVNQFSPTKPEVSFMIERKSDGTEVISYPVVDLAAQQKELGSYLDWSLNSLMKAGVNPDFNVHTQSGTRMEGVSAIYGIDVDSIIDEPKNDE